MISKNKILSYKIHKLLINYPHAADWFSGYGFSTQSDISFADAIQAQPESYFSDIDIDSEDFVNIFYEYLYDMEILLKNKTDDIQSISILPGFDKSKKKEIFKRITIQKGEIVAIVGLTGSGKSQLLADVEWGACGDTPSGRTIFINGKPIERNSEIGNSKKIIAQLSQNMNFVVDLNVHEFLVMHANCWLVDEKEIIIDKILDTANRLAGEKFTPDTHITSLSGGQSRALMIADCAYLSPAPIVLIDEIENAGINRQHALDILAGEDKIVLMATHDPILALMTDFRLIIKNGGIEKVIQKSAKDIAALNKAQEMNIYLSDLREKLRQGKPLV